MNVPRPSSPVTQVFKRHPLNGFNRLAPLYDRIASIVFRGAILTAQRAVIKHLHQVDHALFIGGGSGDLLAEALRRHPQLSFTYLEASSAMIERAKLRLTPDESTRVEWVHATHEWLYDTSYFERGSEEDIERVQNEVEVEDSRTGRERRAIITCFFLDVLTEEEVERLIDFVTPHVSRWLFVDFCPSDSWWSRALLRFMYLCFRLTTGLVNQSLPDSPTLLMKRGWVGVERASFCGEMIHAISYKRLRK
jgi:tRNA (cmo5U34)-methyltransferase